jgi:hypothetical protein
MLIRKLALFAQKVKRKTGETGNPAVTGAAALSLCRASVQIGQWLHKDIRPVPAALTLCLPAGRTCLLWDK